MVNIGSLFLLLLLLAACGTSSRYSKGINPDEIKDLRQERRKALNMGDTTHAKKISNILIGYYKKAGEEEVVLQGSPEEVAFAKATIDDTIPSSSSSRRKRKVLLYNDYYKGVTITISHSHSGNEMYNSYALEEETEMVVHLLPGKYTIRVTAGSETMVDEFKVNHKKTPVKTGEFPRKKRLFCGFYIITTE